jgi:hypothetical protein
MAQSGPLLIGLDFLGGDWLKFAHDGLEREFKFFR